jgi:hypothetical protein
VHVLRLRDARLGFSGDGSPSRRGATADRTPAARRRTESLVIPTIVYVLVLAHFVADFVAQSDWMALNKSKRWDALAFHVAVYISTVMLIVAWGGPFPLLLTWLAVNAVAHFVQDAITSRLTSRLWFLRYNQRLDAWEPGVGSRHWFFVAIGFDQLLHYVTLFVTASWWLQ